MVFDGVVAVPAGQNDYMNIPLVQARLLVPVLLLWVACSYCSGTLPAPEDLATARRHQLAAPAVVVTAMFVEPRTLVDCMNRGVSAAALPGLSCWRWWRARPKLTDITVYR
jgi:hypothetical protein